MDEEALIDAVIRIRSASAEPLTAAQVHKALTDEGANLEFSAVKKAMLQGSKADHATTHQGQSGPRPLRDSSSCQ